MTVPASRKFLKHSGVWALSTALLMTAAAGIMIGKSSKAGTSRIEAGTMTMGGLLPKTKIIHVTNLSDGGPGSLRSALRVDGPRVIVFDVGGAIELKSDLRIEKPDVTVAGQTAPNPGITLHGHSLKVRASNVVVQHVSVRPWSETMAEKADERDGITIFSCDDCDTPTTDVLIENVSASWSVDEGIGLWGKELSRVTIRNSLIAEALRNGGHEKGVHSMGLLIGGGVAAVEVTGNFFVSNLRRNPVVGGGASAFIANNFIYNPGRNSVHVYEGAGTRASLIGNVTMKGPDTDEAMSPFQIQGKLAKSSPGAEIYAADNHCCDGRIKAGTQSFSQPLSPEPVTTAASWKVIPAQDVWSHVSRYAGARPAERGTTDARIVSSVERGDGKVIDSPREVGGDIVQASTEAPPALPANPLAMAGKTGITRLAAWLCLRHFEVGGPQTPQCSTTAEELRAALK